MQILSFCHDFHQLSHPTVFRYFIQKCISGFKDYKDTTTITQTDVLLPLKSVAQTKSEEKPYFYLLLTHLKEMHTSNLTRGIHQCYY